MCFNTQPPEGGWLSPSPSTRADLRFNTQPPEGGWISLPFRRRINRGFNTQPPEGGWVHEHLTKPMMKTFQHTAARRRLGLRFVRIVDVVFVSTHSRPKAAGPPRFETGCKGWFQHTAARRRLGSCLAYCPNRLGVFQHTAARRRLGQPKIRERPRCCVSTHSRPKAAGRGRLLQGRLILVSTHSRPKAAGICTVCVFALFDVSTHSRPKAAGRLWFSTDYLLWFQHTAARRRLAIRVESK